MTKSLAALALLCLLAGCGQGSQIAAGGQPGINVGRAALDAGSADAALQVADNLLARTPNDPQALLLRADAQAAGRHTAEATMSYRAALEADPNLAPARLGLGRMLLASDAKAAEAMFQSVLDADPNSASALNNLGVARDLQNRHAEAQEAYRKALALAPAMQSAAVNLALSLSMTGKAAAAVPMIRALAQAPGATPRVRQNLAAVLAMAGDRPAAASVLKSDLSATEVRKALDVFAALGKSDSGM